MRNMGVMEKIFRKAAGFFAGTEIGYSPIGCCAAINHAGCKLDISYEDRERAQAMFEQYYKPAKPVEIAGGVMWDNEADAGDADRYKKCFWMRERNGDGLGNSEEVKCRRETAMLFMAEICRAEGV